MVLAVDYRKLAEEISRPEYSGKTNQEICDLLNEEVIPIVEDISAGQFLTWLTSVGGFTKLATHAATQLGAPLYDSAQAALRVAGYNASERFHIEDPLVQAQMDAFVQAGVFTELEHDSLMAIGSRQISKATQLGFPFVYPGDVLCALEGGYIGG